MEKIFRNKKVILIAFFTAFSVTSIPALANNSHKTIPVEMKFMGYFKNQLLFKLNFEVINRKTKESVVYGVNRNSGVKEDLTISELK